MKREIQIFADGTDTNNLVTLPLNSSFNSVIQYEDDHLTLSQRRDQLVFSRMSALNDVKRENYDGNGSADYLGSMYHSKDVEFQCDASLGNDEPSDPQTSSSNCIPDYLDHMLLKDRLRLLLSRKVLKRKPDYNVKSEPLESGHLETTHLKDGIDYDQYITTLKREHSDGYFESQQSIFTRRIRPRKRRTRKTDSVETALEEDAPGLLQILLDNGIVPGEIKLYGESNSSDPSEEDFIGLEAVVAKLYFQPCSLLGLAPLRCRTEKSQRYCLACLFSLVEQVRYLHFQKWPAIWGWCRDIKSFIFIFQRHNRLIIERPEYGYATYFFELLPDVPAEWQIRRLVTVMRFTSCGRIALIENKALCIGEDIKEEEANVLMQFGWKPNTGLGTMVNYCDRVIHDGMSETHASEWKSKIRKLLMDGFNGGTWVSSKQESKMEL